MANRMSTFRLIFAQYQSWFVWLITILVIVAGAFMRLAIIERTHFDGLYGQDAFAYYDYGRDVRAVLQELRTPNPTFWPLGYPILLAVGFLIGGVSPQTAQLVSVWTGALTGGIIFRFVYEYGYWHLKWSLISAVMTGLVASLLILFAGQMLQSSAVVMSDVPSVFWACLSVWALFRYQAYRENAQQAYRWLLWASVALGMAAITRWIYGLLIIPWGLACFIIWRGKLPWRGLIVALLPFTLIVGLQLLHSRQNPTAFYDHQWLQSWDIHNATQADFVNADGTFHYERNLLYFYAQPLFDNRYLGSNLAIFSVIGLVGMLINYRRHAVLLTVLLGWTIFCYGFLVGIPYQNIRFSLAFFPPIVLVTALGWGFGWNLSGRVSKVKWILQGMLVLSIMPTLSASYQTGLDDTAKLASRKHKDVAAIEWVHEQIPESEAVVYSLNLHLMMQVYTPDFTNRQIFYETPDTLATELDPTQPTYLFLNSWAIQNQWQGKAPDIAVRWLMAHFYLEHMGRYGNYHLWRVHPPPVGFQTGSTCKFQYITIS